MPRGGPQPGSGRPKGKKNASTLEREAVLKVLRDRIMRNADILFDSQLTIAKGITFLYKIEKEWVGTGGKNGYYRSKKPELVTNQVEIEMYLENQIEEGDKDDDQDKGATYYFLTTKEPNNMAIDSMLDRAFGKSKQGDLDVNVRTPKPLLDNVHSDNSHKENTGSKKTD